MLRLLHASPAVSIAVYAVMHTAAVSVYIIQYIHFRMQNIINIVSLADHKRQAKLRGGQSREAFAKISVPVHGIGEMAVQNQLNVL